MAQSKTQADTLAALAQAVNQLQDSDSFRRFLQVQARFHTYSFGNALLIALQRPDATRVAGYETWKTLKRQVRRGEHGIRILAPHTYQLSARHDSPAGADDAEALALGFHVAHVFDVSQTDGPPLPALECPVLAGEDGAGLYDALAGVAAGEGLTVRAEASSGQLMGFYKASERLIWHRSDVPLLQQVKTLAHELGHHFCGHLASTPKTEPVAEGAAYVVLAHFGLDSGARSVPYMAGWLGNRKLLSEALAAIQRTAATIIERAAALARPSQGGLAAAAD